MFLIKTCLIWKKWGDKFRILTVLSHHLIDIEYHYYIFIPFSMCVYLAYVCYCCILTWWFGIEQWSWNWLFRIMWSLSYESPRMARLLYISPCWLLLKYFSIYYSRLKWFVSEFWVCFWNVIKNNHEWRHIIGRNI